MSNAKEANVQEKSGVKWTKEQQEAIYERGCNLLVAAAAGSGKTAVLVERIIKIITNEQNPIDIDRLLVVTFTNAAAAEMRERIGDAISKELDKNPNSKNLQMQLTLLGRANIMTMHSFCLNVIKNNFHIIDLDPNFRIADETETVLIKQEILEQLMEEKYEKGEQNFIELIESFGGTRDDGPLIDIIDSLFRFVMSNPWPEKWLKEAAEEFNINDDFDISKSKWGKLLVDSINSEIYSAKNKLQEAIDLCEDDEGLIPYMETLKEDISMVENLEKALDLSFDDMYEAFCTLKFSTIKRAKKGADEINKEKAKDLRDDVKKGLSTIRDEIFGVSPKEVIEDIKHMYPIMASLSELIIEFIHEYEVKKRERGLLDFNDLEHLCLKILTVKNDDETVGPSNVALAFKEKFDEVLVDEYQDSNNVQETIIDMVSRKSGENPNVFMVGDVKQSIYRFRQAKPELFLDKYNTYSEESGNKNRKILLYKNFRSRSEVLGGVNYIFKMLMSETVGELEYTDEEKLNPGASFKELEQEKAKVGGPIEVHIIDGAGESFKEDQEEGEANQSGSLEQNGDLNKSSSLEQKSNVSDDEIETEEDDDEELDKAQIEARLVGNIIKDLMREEADKDTFMVFDKNEGIYRKVKYKDIVILMRATASMAPVFVEELGLLGIPCYADSNTGYFNTIEIRTIMSLLQIIDNPLQDIPLLAVLRSPIFSLSPEELVDIRIVDKEKYLYENILELIGECEEAAIDSAREIRIYDEDLKTKLNEFITRLKTWREKAIHMSIDEFIWFLYTETSYYGYVGAMPGGVQRQANLRILFQRARQYEKSSFKGLFNFINFINKLKVSSGDMGSAKILGENEDVVRIMSIHKSKGLEFPVVILSGCGKKFNLLDLSKNILYHDELGYGSDFVDYKRRITYPTLKKLALKRKFKLETLSEEMRILYVALTRAKEKLILTGSVTNLESSAKKWCSFGSTSNEKVPSYGVIKGNSYIDWIGMALAKHKEGKLIREINDSIVKISEDLSTWSIKEWNKSQISVDKSGISVDKSCPPVENLAENNEKYNEEIARRLNFTYFFKKSTEITANITVSEIKRSFMKEMSEQGDLLYEDSIVKKPKFLQEEKGMSAAEKGTIVHFAMQHLDLNRVSSRKEIEEQLDFMVENELLTIEERKAVNLYKIMNFFKSNIGSRMLKAHSLNSSVKREFPFYMEIPATEIDDSLTDEYEHEKVRLQGVIDCYFEEDDKIVLIDYKTDYVGEDNTIDKVVDKYKIQLKYYSEALKEITGKEIKEKVLYLFYPEQEVKV
jgi:ATP-dependent helicase/nuclease subunit A